MLEVNAVTPKSEITSRFMNEQLIERVSNFHDNHVKYNLFVIEFRLLVGKIRAQSMMGAP